MECTTVRPGVQCRFASKNGCTYIGGTCPEIVEQCKGCARVVQYNGKEFCSVYPDPAAKWRRGTCNFATHVKREIRQDNIGRNINPLKAAKRASKRR